MWRECGRAPEYTAAVNPFSPHYLYCNRDTHYTCYSLLTHTAPVYISHPHTGDGSLPRHARMDECHASYRDCGRCPVEHRARNQYLCTREGELKRVVAASLYAYGLPRTVVCKLTCMYVYVPGALEQYGCTRVACGCCSGNHCDTISCQLNDSPSDSLSPPHSPMSLFLPRY